VINFVAGTAALQGLAGRCFHLLFGMIARSTYVIMHLLLNDRPPTESAIIAVITIITMIMSMSMSIIITIIITVITNGAPPPLLSNCILAARSKHIGSTFEA
jgi:hypothetical protein